MTEPAEMDRYTIQTLQRAIKKARKARFPAFHDGERVVYCMRCLKSNHEVEAMVWEPFLCICTDCIRDLAIFAEHLLEKQRHAQTQSEPDEGQGTPDRPGAPDEGC